MLGVYFFEFFTLAIAFLLAALLFLNIFESNLFTRDAFSLHMGASRHVHVFMHLDFPLLHLIWYLNSLIKNIVYNKRWKIYIFSYLFLGIKINWIDRGIEWSKINIKQVSFNHSYSSDNCKLIFWSTLRRFFVSDFSST